MGRSTSDENGGEVIGQVRRDSAWTAEEAQRVLSEQQRSGEGVRVFAEKRGLKPKRLYSWRRRLQRQSSEKAPEFLPLRVVDTSRGVNERGGSRCSLRGSIAIEVGVGCVIRVEAGFAPQLLRAVVAALADEPTC
jgi:hypothetical protein